MCKTRLLFGYPLLLLVTVALATDPARSTANQPNATNADNTSSVPNGNDNRSPKTVRDFGAVGDGKTDDTDSIQRAVDASIGVLRFPRGVYRITRPIVIDLKKVGCTAVCGHGVAQLVMAGPGPALRIVGTHFSSADPGGFSPSVWDRQRMPSVDGLAVLGEHEDAVGIEAIGTMQITLSRLHVRHVRHGIHLVKNNRNVIISNCHIYENRGVGIYYDDVNLHQSNIIGCHISYNASGGIVSRGGNVRNIHITGCDLESNMSPQTEPTANVLIDCRESTWGTAEVAITGCTIQHNHASPGSANIRMIGSSNRGGETESTREGLVTITGNVLSDVFINVHLKQCRGVVITGNTAWRAYTHNLLVEDCEAVVVGPNNFARRDPKRDYADTHKSNNSILFRDCHDSILTGLLVTDVWRDPAGISLINCHRMNVTNCTILDCDHVGLLLNNVTQSRVSGCLIRDQRPEGKASTSIKVIGGHDNSIQEN